MACIPRQVTALAGNSTLHADSVDVNTGVPITMTAAPGERPSTFAPRFPEPSPRCFSRTSSRSKRAMCSLSLMTANCARMQAAASAADAVSARYQRGQVGW